VRGSRGRRRTERISASIDDGAGVASLQAFPRCPTKPWCLALHFAYRGRVTEHALIHPSTAASGKDGPASIRASRSCISSHPSVYLAPPRPSSTAPPRSPRAPESFLILPACRPSCRRISKTRRTGTSYVQAPLTYCPVADGSAGK
jgi:hypothetical protein